MKALIAAFSLVLLLAPSAHAMEKLEGWFIARDTCAAFQSKNKRTNPGDVALVPDTAYIMRGANAPAREWYQVTVPGAPTTVARWVPAGCGVHVIAAPGQPRPVKPDPVTNKPEATDLLLALSWQPAFCERRPGAAECRKLNDGQLPHTEAQLSLHGLWPQPRSAVYCGVSADVKKLDKDRKWDRLPAPALDAVMIWRSWVPFTTRKRSNAILSTSV